MLTKDQKKYVQRLRNSVSALSDVSLAAVPLEKCPFCQTPCETCLIRQKCSEFFYAVDFLGYIFDKLEEE